MSDTLARLKEVFHNDDAPAVREALQQAPELKALINEPLGPFDAPAIVCAKSRGMLDVLLAAGADINAKSRWWAGGFGLLHTADPDLAEYAIERGASIDVHAAARLGKLGRLRELVEADPALVDVRGGDGQTPLHFAATVEIARYLLDHGASIDARDVDHESTAAQYMVRDRQEVARHLIARGCATDLLMASALGELDLARAELARDPSCIRLTVTDRSFPRQNPHSGGTIYTWTLGAAKSPHAVAREFGHADLLELLLRHTPPDLLLAVTAELGDEPAFRKAAASAGSAVGASMPEDTRVRLVDAARTNNTQAVRLMASAGWPIDLRGQHGGTPLHWAAFHGNAEMVEALLPHRPPLETTDAEFHSTPLGWAIHGSGNGWCRDSGDYAATVEALLRAGAVVPPPGGGSEAVKTVLARWREDQPVPQ